MKFEEWWLQNKAVYTALNIPKEVVMVIWNTAIDNACIHLEKRLK